MTVNDLLAGSYRLSKAFVHRMTDDLTPAEFRHQPVPGANSAAWVVGHLAVVARRFAERCGATDLEPLPAGFAERFQATRQSATEQPDLGDPAELMRLFDLYTDAAERAVRSVPAEVLAGPSTVPIAMAQNGGEGLLFGAFHAVMHSGQLSSIRRSLGRPPVV